MLTTNVFKYLPTSRGNPLSRPSHRSELPIGAFDRDCPLDVRLPFAVHRQLNLSLDYWPLRKMNFPIAALTIMETLLLASMNTSMFPASNTILALALQSSKLALPLKGRAIASNEERLPNKKSTLNTVLLKIRPSNISKKPIKYK